MSRTVGRRSAVGAGVTGAARKAAAGGSEKTRRINVVGVGMGGWIDKVVVAGVMSWSHLNRTYTVIEYIV